MANPRVLVVAGTHGNEINAPWLLDQWERHPSLIDSHGLEVVAVVGNPEARRRGRRYIDRDLNRSFRPEWLKDPSGPDVPSSAPADLEILRARDLLEAYGPRGREPCAVAIDLHSTTAAMGSSLVVYGRRPADLALAAALQARLGLPIYLHESDTAQQGFLVECWPCGLVIEIGPVAQMVLSASIVERTRLVLQETLAVLAEAGRGVLRCPSELVIHCHLGSLDVPRDDQGRPAACIHPQLQGRDWQPLQIGDPLFLSGSGAVTHHEGPDGVVPVFINEAAYAEKSIAFSLTRKQQWPLDPGGPGTLRDLLIGSQRGAPL